MTTTSITILNRISQNPSILFVYLVLVYQNVNDNEKHSFPQILAEQYSENIN